MEKFALIYNEFFKFSNCYNNDVVNLFLNLCNQLGVFAIRQKVVFSDGNNEMIESETLLVAIDDGKYNYRSICLSSPMLDNLINGENISYNSFLIPLKFIDSVKVDFNDKVFRIYPIENEGLFFSNNMNNYDIQAFSKVTGLDFEKILSMKNEEFLSDESLFQVLNCISKFSNVKVKEIIEQKDKTKDFFFANSKNLKDDRLSLLKLAESLVGVQIVKDSQNSTFDCASFVSYLFMAELGIDIQFNGIGNSTTGKIMSSDSGMSFLIDEEKSVQEKCGFVLKNAEVGDVLLFHRQSVKSKMVEKDNWYPGHVGIYIGDGKYIDARHRRGDVRVVDINNDEYMNCFIGFKRFILEKEFEPEVLENDKQSVK